MIKIIYLILLVIFLYVLHIFILFPLWYLLSILDKTWVENFAEWTIDKVEDIIKKNQNG